jgi:hypothetical protein
VLSWTVIPSRPPIGPGTPPGTRHLHWAIVAAFFAYHSDRDHAEKTTFCLHANEGLLRDGKCWNVLDSTAVYGGLAAGSVVTKPSSSRYLAYVSSLGFSDHDDALKSYACAFITGSTRSMCNRYVAFRVSSCPSSRH